jgi:murein DD-endopeptidase MepM/ murein hydrolase activator NlpD
MPLIFAAVLVMHAISPCWSPPVDAPVIDPYRSPGCTYCPGNRGLEYGPHPGQPVTAVSSGTVSFAGSVVGTRYVVVDHPDGVRATYGRLATVTVHRGQMVDAGAQVGTTTAGFYFGLRRGVAPNDISIDPTALLRVRRYPSRLVPVDGTAPISPGPGRLTCRNTLPGR